MSVWLTPDLKPIVGGTYFPPDDRYYGRPGFKSILKKIAQQVTMFHISCICLLENILFLFHYVINKIINY